MPKFEIGEIVRFLFEEGEGCIVDFKSPNYIVKDEFGFNRPYQEDAIVKIIQKEIKVSKIDLKDKVERKLKKDTEGTPYLVYQHKNTEYWEVDLHIEELVDSHRGMTNYEILTEQMKHFRQFFRTSIDHRIKKMVVVHGYGEGVLKNEIHSYLKSLNYVDFYEADFRRYGQGATQIEVLYNRLNQFI